MRFYRGTHRHYGAADLHANNMYLCVLDTMGNIQLHRRIGNDGGFFVKQMSRFSEDLVFCCESTYNYYWLYDVCVKHGIQFVLAHALYLKAIHGAKTKNDRKDSERLAMLLRGGLIPMGYPYPHAMRPVRDLMRRRTHFVCHRAALLGHIRVVNTQYNLPSIPVDMRYRAHDAELLEHFSFCDEIRSSVSADVEVIQTYQRVIKGLEKQILRQARLHRKEDLDILRTMPGIGDIIALTILYEIDDVDRFDGVGNFSSYSRLVKCSHISNGKKYGFGGKKIGNPYLKWVFSEAAIHMPHFHEKTRNYLRRLERKHGKGRSKTILAHKIGRAVYWMLKHKEAFDEKRFLSR